MSTSNVGRVSNVHLNILQVPTPLTAQQAEEVGHVSPILQMEKLRCGRIMLPDQRKDGMTGNLDPGGVKNGFSTSPLYLRLLWRKWPWPRVFK